MIKKKPRIALTMGDASGIGPEVVLKALNDPDIRRLAQFALIGDGRYLESIAKVLIHKKLNIYALSNIEIIEKLKIRGELQKFTWGKINKQVSRAALEYIRQAAKLAIKGIVSAVVTAPVNKEAINRAGFKFSGHTEYLAKLSQVKNFAMMLIGGGWRVILVTRHLPLKRVSRSLTKEKIAEAIGLGHQGLKKLGIKHPRLAVAAFNPHAGEGGFLGDEEKKFITPAIREARKKGMSVSGPFPSDTLFRPENKNRYDAQVVMYHDQGLIPLKMSGFENSVNVTWGLPFVRTSPGHGTAYEIAGEGKANPESMKEAIRLAVKLSGEPVTRNQLPVARNQ